MSDRLTPQHEAESAVESLVNGGYTRQIAKEIVSLVRAEAAEETRAKSAVELAAVRAERDELKRPAIEKYRAETRSSFTALTSEAEQAKDYEGAALLAQELAKAEEQWKRDDEEATS